MTALAGRVVAITGGGGGIGRALAVEAARRGAAVAVSDIDADALAATVDAVGAERKVHAAVVDVADRAAVHAWADEVAGALGEVGVAINNAGFSMTAHVMDADPEAFDRLLAVDLGGVVNGTQAFLPHLVDSGEGHLVNVSSIFGFVAGPMLSAYCTAKFAVRGYSESVAMDLALRRQPVRVTVVHPGGVRTGLARNNQVAEGMDTSRITAVFERMAVTRPARAASRTLDAVERNRSRVVIGPDAWAMRLGERALGTGFNRLMTIGLGGLLERVARPSSPQPSSPA